MAFRKVPACFTIHGQRVLTAMDSRSVIQFADKEPDVAKLQFLVIGVVFAGLGCSHEPGPIERAANAPIASAREDVPVNPPPQTEPALDDNADLSGEGLTESRDGEPTDSEGPAGSQELELKESGVSFAVPGSWKRVTPPNNIIEAEFLLPRAEGDDYDGRLTLMASGGAPQETIATRTGEFNMQPGETATTERLSIAGFEALLVDLRGEWKGSAFQPMPPRADYRMLLFVIPFSERSGFYAKLTGPRTTIAAHEAAFREFLRSAKVTREAPK
jgi:hypothetical protein